MCRRRGISMIADDIQFKKDCLRRHYESLDRPKALLIHGELTTKAAKRKFKKRVNYAHGYELI